MAQTYVPGYGYVDSNDPGTSGSVKKRNKPFDTGQNGPDYVPPPVIPSRFPFPDQPGMRLEFGDPQSTRPNPGRGAQNSPLVTTDSGVVVQQDEYQSEDTAQSVADVTNGYVVEASPGVYKVVYGIYAAQAANRDAQKERALRSPEAKGAGNFGSDPNAPSAEHSVDAGYYGSTTTGATPYIPPDRLVPDYSIYSDQSQLPKNGLMTVDTYEKLKAKQDGTAMGVYMGTLTQAGTTGAVATDVVKDARVVSDYTMLSDEEQRQVLALTAKYYSGMPWQFSWVEKRWAKAVDSANRRLMLYGEKITPFEVYDRIIQHESAARAERQASGGGGGYGGYGGYGGGGMTQSTIRLTSSTDARVVLNQAMRQYLGRDATPDEIGKFVKLLNTQERANPIVQTMEGSTALQYGGFNPQTFAEDFARSQDGSSEYGAVTGLLDAMIGALNGNTGVL